MLTINQRKTVSSGPRIPRQRTEGTALVRRSWVVSPNLTGPRQARYIARQQLAEWRLHEHADTAELLVSELVTNAITHGEGPITLSLRSQHGRLRCEVTDSYADLPQLRPTSPDCESGRGMQLVDMLARRWGVRCSEHHKTVWFELATCTAQERCL
ncbi:ATP-binding protein [Streptomyces sioyaensis]|uniref:ATP-binding protein n=1 Tax=Streptomyces sioyaensis TaxID=67364 RepID=UPI00379BA315